MVDYAEGAWVRLPALTEWQVVVAEDGKSDVSGPCPRCRHLTSSQLDDAVITVRAAPPAAEVTRQVTCNCDTAHPKTATGKRGCGARWLVGLAETAEGWVVVRGNPAARDAATALADALATESTNLTTAAEKWLPGIAVLYGLFGLAGLATSADEVTALDLSARWAVAILGLLALAATSAAVICSYRAAYGWPTTVDVSTDEKLLEWHDGRRTRLASRAWFLTASVVLALLSTALLTGALGLVWFGPAESPAAPKVEVVHADGSDCGKIVAPKVDEKGVLVLLRVADGGGTEEVPIPIDSVESIVPSTCS